MPGGSRPWTGFFGKIPSRSDFVASGLPRPLVCVCSGWIGASLGAANEALGPRLDALWSCAPVWRVAMAPAGRETSPHLGVLLPSVDKVARRYPLLIATACPGANPERMARHGTAWLDAAEDAARAAIAEDLSPDLLMARIPPSPELGDTADAGIPYDIEPRPGASLWWTEGGPRVPAHGLVLDGLPDAATFVAMLGGGAEPAP